MPRLPEQQPESFHLHPTLKAIIKAIGLAAAAILLQACDGKIPDEATLQGSKGSKVSDIERVRHGCAGGVEKTGGLIECRDVAGFTTLVTSSGD